MTFLNLLEPLEPRIAPATLTGLEISADGHTAKYRDADGDIVTVKTTAGTFDPSNFDFGDASGDADLLTLDLHATGDTSEFSDANLTFTVKKGPGKTNGLSIGRINAEGVDLGKVKIAGNLGAIDAGDLDYSDTSLVSLAVKSFGAESSSSLVKGSIGSIAIADDFTAGSFSNNSDAPSRIDSIKIGGSFTGSILGSTLGSFSSGDVTHGILRFDGTSEAAKLKFKHVTYGEFDIAGTIDSLKASQVDFAGIHATRINSVAVAGNFGGAITIAGAEDTSIPALGKATFGGVLRQAYFTITGDVGKFSADAMLDSSLNMDSGTLHSFKISGHRAANAEFGASLYDTDISATSIGNATIQSAGSPGLFESSISFTDSVGKIQVKSPKITYTSDSPATVSEGGLTIQKVSEQN